MICSKFKQVLNLEPTTNPFIFLRAKTELIDKSLPKPRLR